MAGETRDFDQALELLAQLEGRAVAVALLAPRASPAMTAVVHGTLEAARMS